MKINYILSVLTVFMVLILTTIGCGGGGSGNSIKSTPEISTNQAFPSQVITVSDALIKANEIVEIEFKQISDNSRKRVLKAEIEIIEVVLVEDDNQDSDIDVVEDTTDTTDDNSDTNNETIFSTTVLGIAAIDGQVDIAVPVFINPENGEFDSGTMSVTLNGRTSKDFLQIEKYSDLDVDTNGRVLVAMLELTIDSYLVTIDNLNTMAQELSNSTDISNAQNYIDDEIARLQDMIDQISSGFLTVNNGDSTTVLSSSELNQLDLELLYKLNSVSVLLNDATQERSFTQRKIIQNQIFKSIKSNWLEAKNQLNESDSAQYMKDFVSGFYGDSLVKGREAAEFTATMVGGLISLMSTTVSLGTDKALALVASRVGITNALRSALASFIFAETSKTNTDAFLSRDKGLYDRSGEFLSQGVRVVSQLSSSVPAILLNTGLTLKDMFVANKVDLCNKLGMSNNFCTEQNIDEIPADETSTKNELIAYWYRNFDGTTGTDPESADIKISDDGIISWGSKANFLVVVEGKSEEQKSVYGIKSIEVDGKPTYFNSPIKYGDYTIENIKIDGENPSPAMKPEETYVLQVMQGKIYAIIYFVVR